MEEWEMIDKDSPEKSDFHNHLIKNSEILGFSESKKSIWVTYMLDTTRGKKLLEHILSYFDLTNKKGFRVLDIGCGYGGLLIALQLHFEHVFGIEIIKERTEWARKRAPSSDIICGSATNLPWPDEYFDLIISTEVFEHISYKEQEKAIHELWRVLKPDGHGFITVPNRFQLLDEHNFVLFGTWLPKFIREKYVKLKLKNDSYTHCYERTGYNWKKKFEENKFKVAIKPIITTRKVKMLKLGFLQYLLASNYEIVLIK